MAAILNGLSLSKIRAFGGDFFSSSAITRWPSIRCLAALMGAADNLRLRTHDAMGDGEDGPTHQPLVEQLISMRAMPGLVLLRPADGNEVVEAYRYVLRACVAISPPPSCCRANPLPTFDRTRYALQPLGWRRGRT